MFVGRISRFPALHLQLGREYAVRQRHKLRAGGVAPLDFAEYSRIGRALGDLHVGYENAAPYEFTVLDTKPEGQKFSFRVEKMRFYADRSTLRVNDCITLSGFVPAMFEYKLGNRSALDWIVESYRVKEDARSGLVSDPNRKDQPKFILHLIGKVATVSLETQKLIGQLPIYKPEA